MSWMNSAKRSKLGLRFEHHVSDDHSKKRRLSTTSISPLTHSASQQHVLHAHAAGTGQDQADANTAVVELAISLFKYHTTGVLLGSIASLIPMGADYNPKPFLASYLSMVGILRIVYEFITNKSSSNLSRCSCCIRLLVFVLLFGMMFLPFHISSYLLLAVPALVTFLSIIRTFLDCFLPSIISAQLVPFKIVGSS